MAITPGALPFNLHDVPFNFSLNVKDTYHEMK